MDRVALVCHGIMLVWDLVVLRGGTLVLELLRGEMLFAQKSAVKVFPISNMNDVGCDLDIKDEPLRLVCQ